MIICAYFFSCTKNTVNNIEQVLEAAPHKAAAVRPTTTHHKKCQN